MDKKIFQNAGISIAIGIVSYIVAIFVLRGNLYFPAILKPYAYMTLMQWHLAKTIAFAVGLIYFSIALVVWNTKRVCADKLLIAFSYIIPIVGLILCIVYRAKEKKNAVWSNAFLLTTIASVAPIVLIAIYFILGQI